MTKYERARLIGVRAAQIEFVACLFHDNQDATSSRLFADLGW